MRKNGYFKSFAVNIGNILGIYPVGSFFYFIKYRNSYIRALNYHDIKKDSVDNFREQLEFFRRNFVNVTPEDLSNLISGCWEYRKPGILLSFDDGLLSHYEIAAPLLEEYGFTGWFFVPTGWVMNEDKIQQRKNDIKVSTMTIRQIRDLVVRGHVIGCHTHNHIRLSDNLTNEELKCEIIDAKSVLENILGGLVSSFCWVGGEEYSYSQRAAEMIKRSGFRWSFMTNCSPITSRTDPFWLDRTNIESDWPISKVKFYISGVMDLVYLPKRKRLRKKLTSSE